MLSEREQKIYDQTIKQFNLLASKPIYSTNQQKSTKPSLKTIPLIIPKIPSFFGSLAKGFISSMNQTIKKTKTPSIFIKNHMETKPISPKRIISKRTAKRINIKDCIEEIEGEIFWDLYNLEQLNYQIIEDEKTFQEKVIQQTEIDLSIFRKICKL